MKNLKTKSLQAFFWSFAQILSGGLITFLVGIYLARILDPADFGLIGMIAIFMAIGQTLVEGGLASSLIRTKAPDDRDYTTVFFINLIGSFIIYGICYFLAPYIAQFYEQPVLSSILRVYTLGFLIAAFTIVQETKLVKELDFKMQFKIKFPATIISGIAGITFAKLGYGVWSLVYLYLLNKGISSLLFWYYAQWQPQCWIFDKERFKYHFNYGYKLTISGLMNTIMGNIYYVIIGKLFSPALLGFYVRANETKQLPVNIFSSVLNKVTFPLFANIQDQPKKLKAAYQKVLGLIVFLLAPLMMGAAVLAEPLFEFLFTAKWLPAVPYFQLLCIIGILYPLHGYNLNILKVFGRSDLFLRLELIKQVLVAINVVVAIQFGIYGLLYGQIAVSLIAFFINTHYSGRFIDYPTFEQIKDFIPALFLSALAMLLVYWVDQYLFLSYSNFIRLLSGSLLGATIYLLLAKFGQLRPYKDMAQLVAAYTFPFLKRKRLFV